MKVKPIEIRNFILKGLHLLFLRCTINTKSNIDGYNVFGYVSKILGQSEVVRAFVDDLIEKDEDFTLTDIVNFHHKKISAHEESKYRYHYTKDLKYKNNIFFIDLKFLAKIKRIIPSLFNGKHNIAAFWWEFETGFDDRVDTLNDFDEIYVFSDFVKETLNRVENKKFIITKIKYPFKKNWNIEESVEEVRKKYHLTGKFCYFFNMDYRSSYNRKNPEAIIAALYEEFLNEENVVLVVKTNNENGFPDKENQLKNFISDRNLNDRVLIVKVPLSRNSFAGLLNSMDCYISLHRGEGLGLGILEAIDLEKPVIATNYGGNTEYMHHALAYPVKYSLIPANDDFPAYKSVKLWANPDIEDAKRCMREVFKKFKK